jgi:tRNA dimethylallyltransferase
VRALMALNLDPELPILRAHGVPELMAYLRGEMTLAEAISKAQQNTRNYAKRQMTWLRNQWPGVPVVRDGAGISIQL